MKSARTETATQPPYNTSFMGVLHAASEHYEMGLSTEEVFGATGHAFMMNVHEALCPSGPYVWDHAPVYRLARNIGLQVADLGSVHGESSSEERRELEGRIRNCLDEGVLCGIVNMDHQLIRGYDARGLDLCEPWGSMNMTPPRLTFGSWVEMGDELHAGAYSIAPCDRVDQLQAAKEALRFAVEISEYPDRYAHEHYGIAGNAYEKWIGAIEDGHGGGHGAWWNGTVWGECRCHAARYLRSIAAWAPSAAGQAEDLADVYDHISNALIAAAEKEMPPDEKVRLLRTARDQEAQAVRSIPGLITALRGVR